MRVRHVLIFSCADEDPQKILGCVKLIIKHKIHEGNRGLQMSWNQFESRGVSISKLYITGQGRPKHFTLDGDDFKNYSWIYLDTLIKWNGRSQFFDIWGTLKIFKIALNITNYINLQDSIGFGLSNEFLQRKLVKISKKVVEVSYISQVPTKAEL